MKEPQTNADRRGANACAEKKASVSEPRLRKSVVKKREEVLDRINKINRIMGSGGLNLVNPVNPV